MMRTKIGASNHQIGDLLTFALVAVFAILALFLVVVGIEDYQSVLIATERNSDLRVSFGYIANKIRTSDGAGRVSVDEIGGQDVLLLKQFYDDEEETILIYYYDGMLREQSYDQADEDFMLEDGEEIVGAKAFSIQMDDRGLIDIEVISMDDQVHRMQIAARGSGRDGGTES